MEHIKYIGKISCTVSG